MPGPLPGPAIRCISRSLRQAAPSEAPQPPRGRRGPGREGLLQEDPPAVREAHPGALRKGAAARIGPPRRRPRRVFARESPRPRRAPEGTGARRPDRPPAPPRRLERFLRAHLAVCGVLRCLAACAAVSRRLPPRVAHIVILAVCAAQACRHEFDESYSLHLELFRNLSRFTGIYLGSSARESLVRIVLQQCTAAVHCRFPDLEEVYWVITASCLSARLENGVF